MANISIGAYTLNNSAVNVSTLSVNSKTLADWVVPVNDTTFQYKAGASVISNLVYTQYISGGANEGNSISWTSDGDPTASGSTSNGCRTQVFGDTETTSQEFDVAIGTGERTIRLFFGRYSGGTNVDDRFSITVSLSDGSFATQTLYIPGSTSDKNGYVDIVIAAGSVGQTAHIALANIATNTGSGELRAVNIRYVWVSTEESSSTIIDADGSAAGAASVEGVASATHSVPGSAVGVASVAGVASATHSVAGSAAGVASVDGQAEDASIIVLDADGSAAGAASVEGVASATHSVPGSAVGVASVEGVASATHSVAGSAAGVASVDGQAENGANIIIAADGSAAGAARVEGVASLTVIVVGSAAGTSNAFAYSNLISSSEKRYSQAIKEAYASAPAGWVVIDTLEFRHPNFVDENGNRTAIRIVCGHKSLTAKLESTAPLHPSQFVTFIPMAFDLELPNVEHIAQPEIGFSVDNVSREIEDNLSIAANSPYPIEVTYRPYLDIDLTEPQMNPPMTFTLISAEADDFRVSGRASYGNAANRLVPRDTYTTKRFPGLRR